MAKQRFLNNFTSTFIAAVKDAPSSGTPETELDYGVLRISDGAAGSLINPTDGDYYLLTAFKRSGSIESNIEVMRVTGVSNATPGECRITVQRAQEGTSAKAFVAGDYLSLRITRGTAENFSQPADLATKEPVIAAPVAAPTEKYWRGDKTWRDFFTDVRAATLTGLSTATNAVVAATDTVLAAIGKLQAQVSSKFDKTGGDIFGNVNLPSLNGGQLAGLRNKIINGNMEIAQRGATVSLSTPGQFSVDRWVHTWDGTGATRAVFRQEFPSGTGPENIRYFLSLPQSVAGSGGTYNALEQRIEGVGTFAGQTVTLSFYARNNASTPLPQIICRQFFGVTGSATINTTVATNVTVTDGFTRHTYAFTVPSIVGKTISGGGDYLSILFLLPINSVFTFDITGVQLEVGAVATPFEHRPYGMELALCQRYYYRFTPTAADQTLGVGHNTSATAAVATAFFPVPMRTAPSALEQSGTAGDYSVAHAATSTVCGAVPTLLAASPFAATITLTVASGLAAGQGSRARAVNASSYLGFPAEL